MYLTATLIVISLYVINYFILRHEYKDMVAEPIYDNNGHIVSSFIRDKDKNTIGKLFLASPVVAPVFILFGVTFLVISAAIWIAESRNNFFAKISSLILEKEKTFAVIYGLSGVPDRRIAFSSVQELENIHLVKTFKNTNFSKFVIDNFSENESNLFAIYKDKDWPQHVGTIAWLEGKRLDIPKYYKTDVHFKEL